MTTAAWAARDGSGHLSPYSFNRRPCGDDDIHFKVVYCGICHSDLHQIKNEWGGSTYPMVPGHEIVGEVINVGKNVKSFKAGDKIGVGCIVDSCRECEACKKDEENYCAKNFVGTYNAKDYNHGDEVTQGGYSSDMVVDQNYALHIPDNLDFAATAPLLCAGITTYSPIMYYGLNKKGTKLGVVGLGGLGHMVVKFGVAMGCEVTVISTSDRKRKEAMEVLGAHHFVISKDDKQMAEAASSLDGIIDTVSAPHDLHQMLGLLKTDGRLIIVGVPPEPFTLHASKVIFGRKTFAGSLIGGIKETQEMLDFCGKNNITCEIEKIDASYLNTAMDRLVKNDVHYRFVIDVANTLKAE